jgi:hypothetical protein
MRWQGARAEERLSSLLLGELLCASGADSPGHRVADAAADGPPGVRREHDASGLPAASAREELRVHTCQGLWPDTEVHQVARPGNDFTDCLNDSARGLGPSACTTGTVDDDGDNDAPALEGRGEVLAVGAGPPAQRSDLVVGSERHAGSPPERSRSTNQTPASARAQEVDDRLLLRHGERVEGGDCRVGLGREKPGLGDAGVIFDRPPDVCRPAVV